MIKKILSILLLFGFVLPVILVSCSTDSNVPVEKQGFYMGTVIIEKVFGINGEKAAAEGMKRIEQIEAEMTINSPGSEIDRLNEAAGSNKGVGLSKDSITVMKIAKKFSGLSDGAFDVTIGPLVKAWGIFTQNPRVPEKNEIERLLKLTSYKDIDIDEANGTAKLARPGQIVDLGGIGKGYAGEEVIKVFKENGIKSAYVNLGGNVVVLGGKPDGSPWNIGIQNPRAENGKYIGIIKAKDKALVSSGDYERFFEKDGVKYHHIIDTKTGYPSDSGLIGTTIVADSSTDADALSTAVFVLGLEKGRKLVESLEGVEAVFITRDKKVYITSGLKDVFTFVDESREFQYVEER